MENRAQIQTSEREARGMGWITVFLGIWLMIAPFALEYDYAVFQTARWNDIIVGVLVTFVALARAVRGYRRPLWSWVHLALGIWLVLAPLVLGYAAYETAQWNDILIGAALVFLSLNSAIARRPA